ncbi:MAG: hypothetical protein ABFD97_19125 [Syntrophobacter sp.]
MEEKYGRSWVIPVSSLMAAIIASTAFYLDLFYDWSWYIMLFIGLTFTTPGLMRYVICHKWKPIEAKIINSENLSRAYVSWAGASMSNCYQADIEYNIGETAFRAKMTSTFPFKKNKIIFYNPVAPSVFTQNKNPGLYGLGFLVLVVLSILKGFGHR